MGSIRVPFWLSEAGQKAQLAAGGNAAASQSIEVAADAPEFSAFLALADVDYKGVASLDAYKHRLDRIKWDCMPTPSQVLEAIAQSKAAREAEEIAEREESVAAALAEGPDHFIVGTHYDRPRLYARPYSDDPRVAHLIAEAEQVIERENARLDAEKAEREAAKRAKIEAAETERATWIAAHGSTRLQRMLAEGIEHDRVYRDERLALERPGWVYYQDTDGTTKTPRNVPESAFSVLDEARKIDPGAVLMFYAEDAKTDEYGDETSPAIRKYVAEAEFLGATILFGLDD